jgi:hypothetical protein
LPGLQSSHDGALRIEVALPELSLRRTMLYDRRTRAMTEESIDFLQKVVMSMKHVRSSGLTIIGQAEFIKEYRDVLYRVVVTNDGSKYLYDLVSDSDGELPPLQVIGMVSEVKPVQGHRLYKETDGS